MQACVELVKDVCSTLMYILYYNVMYIHVFLLSLLLYIILSPSCILSVVRERVFVDVDVSRYPNSSKPDGKTNLLIIKYIGYQRSPQLWWSPRRILSMNEIVLIFFFFFDIYARRCCARIILYYVQRCIPHSHAIIV